MPPEMPALADGRAARSARTRDAVVDALLALIEAGDLQPTAPRVAARAHVSLRSVFQHFEDMEALFAAAADRQTARILRLTARLPRAGSLRQRLDGFVRQRAGVLEAITPVRRSAVLMEPFSNEVAARLRRARILGQTEVRQLFAPELADCSPAVRRMTAAAVSAVSSWPMWEALRTHHGLSRAAATEAMRLAIERLLAPAASARRSTRRSNGRSTHAG